MQIGTVIICMFISALARCVMFQKRDVKWWKALIPCYNKVILGKMSNSKKIGIINAIMLPVLYIYFLACFGYELWIMENYTQWVRTDPTATNDSLVQVVVPKEVANTAIYSKYVLIGLAAIALICWIIFAIKYVKANKLSYWWMLWWVIVPVVPYCYFAISNKRIVINGKSYEMKRVEVK